ncbi:MAG: histidinol-phosphate transaminase [Agriterribacter sp.]
MSLYTKHIDIYQPHILASTPYRGGSTREEHKTIRYKMSSNENMLGMSPMALEAIRENLHRINEYSFEHDRLFCQALANHFHNALSPDQFITGNGGMELLDIIVRGFVQPGNEVIISTPTFMAYNSFAVLGGARVIDVPLQGSMYDLDVEGILGAITEQTRLIFISNPNNPTGTLIQRERIDELMEGLPDHVVVVYDEVYHDYVEAKDYPRALDYIQQYKNVIGLHSFSKAYGLAGMRIAYAFSTHPIALYLQKIKRPFMVNALSMVAAMAGLKDRDFLEKTKAVNTVGKLYLYKKFKDLNIQYTPTEANFILITPPFKMTATALVHAMAGKGIMLRDAEVMKAPGKVRVTIGTAAANSYFTHSFTHEKSDCYAPTELQ